MHSSRRWGAAPRNLITPKTSPETTEERQNFRSLAVIFCAPESHHETADDYVNTIAQLCPRRRVIVYKDAIQWILQARRGQRHGQPRWEALQYCRTRDALIRLSHTFCSRIDPAALAILLALPDQIGGAA